MEPHPPRPTILTPPGGVQATRRQALIRSNKALGNGRAEFSFGHQGLLSGLGATADRNNRVPASVGRAGRRPYNAAARRIVSNAAGERTAQLSERTRVASGSRSK